MTKLNLSQKSIADPRRWVVRKDIHPETQFEARHPWQLWKFMEGRHPNGLPIYILTEHLPSAHMAWRTIAHMDGWVYYS